jgi:hypothetical protein
VLPQSSSTVFKVTGGGRIYVDSINAVMGITGATILNVVGSDSTNGFYHINAMTGDGGSEDFHVFKNDDDGDGLQHFRFTNAHLLSKDKPANNLARVNIDRTGGNGQSVLEFVGCKGLTEKGEALTNRVIIKGASSSKRSRLIVRDSGIANADDLIDAVNSSHYTENRIKNWTFAGGVQSST